MKGIFLDTDSICPDDLDLTPLKSTLTDWHFANTSHPHKLEKQIEKADIVVTNKVLLDDILISDAMNLKLICVAATGVNNIDIDSATRNGVCVCNVRGYATASVVEHIFSTLLTLNRQLDIYRSETTQKKWPESPYFCLFDKTINDLSGKTLGIIGYGELGKAVTSMGNAFGMKVLVAERKGNKIRTGRIPLNDLLTKADVVSLHCPLNETTKNIIDAAAIRRMKNDAILINTARGGLVNEAALANALSNNQLAGASLDVLSVEPPPADHVLLNTNLPNLILTPHIAWASRSSRQNLIDEIAENIAAFLNGSIRNQVL